LTGLGKWLPAGRFLSARIEAASKSGDWRGDWIEADIIASLATSDLLSRGRRLALDKMHPHQIDREWCELIAGFEKRPRWMPVSDIPKAFWSDIIHYSGGRWPKSSASNWPEAMFGCGSENWRAVEIFEPSARRAGGRPPKYDWPAFEQVAIGILEDEGGLSASFRQSDLESQMSLWADNGWGTQPTISLIRSHVKAAIAIYNTTISDV